VGAVRACDHGLLDFRSGKAAGIVGQCDDIKVGWFQFPLAQMNLEN
jgi:hypothetical protein